MRFALALFLLFAAPAFAHDHADKDAHGHEAAMAPATPVQTTLEGAVYGAKLPQTPPAAIDLDSVIADPDALLGKPGAFSGHITEVCQKMGCWMVLAADNGEFARVIMHDHAFGVPKDAKGDAVVYGTLTEKTATAEEVEHLKKDGAKAPTTRELRIDATSVLIRTASRQASLDRDVTSAVAFAVVIEVQGPVFRKADSSVLTLGASSAPATRVGHAGEAQPHCRALRPNLRQGTGIRGGGFFRSVT